MQRQPELNYAPVYSGICTVDRNGKRLVRFSAFMGWVGQAHSRRKYPADQCFIWCGQYVYRLAIHPCPFEQETGGTRHGKAEAEQNMSNHTRGHVPKPQNRRS